MRARGAGTFALPSRSDVLSSLGLDKWRDQRLDARQLEEQVPLRATSPTRNRARGTTRESRDLEAGEVRVHGPVRTISK